MIKYRKRRIRLEIRQFGNSWSVGYWDGESGDPLKDFRCLGSRATQELAKRCLLVVLSKDSRYY